MSSDNPDYSTWPHAPAHLFVANAAYMVTGGTHGKVHLFNSPEKVDCLQSTFFEECERLQWSPQAWAFLANHYHFIAFAPDDAHSLKTLIRRLHSRTAVWLNKLDASPGRKVWYQYSIRA